MAWEFTAENANDLAKVRRCLPERARRTVAGELFQMSFLLEALASTDVPSFPFTARHTGETGVPDFHVRSGNTRIGVEMAKVTMQNLEHARALQAKFPDPPLRFEVRDLCYPEDFARRLRAKRDGWACFVSERLSEECRSCLARWNGREQLPHATKADFISTLNAIVDGSPIAAEATLKQATPRPELVEIEGVQLAETPRQRKAWLEEAFEEFVAVPISGTLAISPFIRRDDDRMTRAQVLQTGFLFPALTSGPSLGEEQEIWVERICDEVEDKTVILAEPRFQHGDEDWLVLWDQLGTAAWEVPVRARAIEKRLASFWSPKWFSRIFVQDEHFDWQLMFTRDTSLIVSSQKKSRP